MNHRARCGRDERGAGTLEYVGVIVVAAVLVVAVIAGVRSTGAAQHVAAAVCDIRSAFSQAGDCGGDDAPTTYDGQDGDGLTAGAPGGSGEVPAGEEQEQDDAPSPDYVNAADEREEADPERVADALEELRDALEGGFFGVRAGDLEDARDAVEDLNGRELDALIASMDDEELERWVSQMEDGWLLGGWSREERRELWELLASRASKATLDRLSGFTDELQPSFEGVGGDGARDDPQSPANVAEFGEVAHDLFVGTVRPQDVSQGMIGDCWWIASMMAVAQADPQVIRDAITTNPNGTYTVHLYRDGQRVAVTVTPDMVLMPDGTPAFVSNDGAGPPYELWPMVLEKALALEYGDYEQIEGGWPSDGMTALTGRESTSHGTGDLSIQQLASTLSDGGAIGVASLEPEDAKKSTYYQQDAGANRLFANHAYYVQSVDVKGGTVTLVNPWGIAGNPPITMPYTDYLEQFRQVDVNEVS
ncbi:C2 family cysteine protease [Cellulomonas wangsupingiae]|uniref:C2 family cysteine protease n=1 Tax=Cellulomonas wangsupingiae TaxID=2968085 RepID=UPI001D0F2D9F|nr:C2 family cysteine protease [Cellulomonas wangsupingiae]MCM0639724.1 C2 family cysteine protease [Cellulomonas wangsupingiae]